MSLKGHAKIELVNADGTKEVVEHGNMITDAVNDLLYSARGEQSNILRICSNGNSFIEQMFGGILLFKDTLNSDKSDYYIPSVNTVGYSSIKAYNGLDVERGSFNASESGPQEDGTYKLVWDFATSQANGTIKSLALCPNMMGNIGLSNSAVDSEKVSARTLRSTMEPFSTNNNLLPNSGNTNDLSNCGYNIVAVIGNIAYAIHTDNIKGSSSTGIRNNGGILKLFRFDVSANGVDLRGKVGVANYIDTVEVQLPTEYTSSLASDENAVDYSCVPEENKLILYRCYLNGDGLTQGSSLKYVEIELANNMNVTLKTFTNNATATIRMNGNHQPAYSAHGSYTWFYIAKDYVVFHTHISSTERRLYVAKKSDNTDIKEVKFADGSEFNSIKYGTETSNSCFRPIFAFGNMFVFGYTSGSQYTAFKDVYILDMSTGLMKKTNAKEMTYRSNIQIANKVTWAFTGTYLAMGVSVNPFVLCTKNNLDVPVTKTASQTMKITYTLTETAVV